MVLFDDLKGPWSCRPTAIPRRRKLLDSVLERMMETVHRYEVTVHRVMGGAIVALFGAPLAHDDHAVPACYTAPDMQAAIRRCAEGVRRAQGPALDIRVRLNSSEVWR